MVEDGDLYGDGVNIAARLEGLAEPGDVFLSETVFGHVRGKVEVEFEDLGEQNLKNMAEPVRVYRLAGFRASTKTMTDADPVRTYRVTGAPVTAHTVPKVIADKPSIAILPFENMSGDAEQEYFCDGMVEEIITALSRLRWLFVIARNSSFTYKGRAVDVKQIGRELGVRYVLEGSVRKAGNRVRITGQLIDASTRRASLGRPLRGRARGHLRPAGPGDRECCRRDRAEARAGRDRARQAQADREPRRLRLLSARHGGRPSMDSRGQ